MSRCDTCHRDHETYDLEEVPLCEGRTVRLCRECLSHISDFAVRIGMV